MAKKRKPGRPPKRKPGRPPKSEGKNNASGGIKMNPKTFWSLVVVGLVTVSAVIILSFIGIAGSFGEAFKNILLLINGPIAILIPFLCIWIAIQLVKRQKDEEFVIRKSEYAGLVLILLSISGVAHLLNSRAPQFVDIAKDGEGGGYIGYLITFPLYSFLDTWVTLIIFLGMFVVGVLFISKKTIAELFELVVEFAKYVKMLPQKISNKKVEEETGIKIKGIEDIEDSEQELKNNSEEKKPFKKPKIVINKPEVAAIEKIETSKPLSGTYKTFDLSLLIKKGEKPVSGDIRKNAHTIEGTLKSFNIGVQMEEVNIGPTVTQYTFRPNTGVKLSQIVTLQNDLSLALAAHPLRIEAPVPGRSVVGVEIPNKKTALVRLREILASEELKKKEGKLKVALGRDVSGKVMVIDIAALPHLLIAGATGSGKSVGIHVIILSLLFQYGPDELKFIMVDPKKVELTHYNEIPHLLTKVITEPDKTVNALRWAVAEMERRYRVLSEVGKRDIASYNEAFPDKKMPFIVAILDELADLMSVAANEVEAAVVRLAQMSRAVGIHLILATQRPSVNVITGLIKANITARIAFTVASVIDSRTILDASGAEKLLGKGDMLYEANELGGPRRIQGAYVTENEMRDVVNYIKQQAKPEYNEEITEKKTSTMIPGSSSSGEGEDELFDQAKEIVIQAGKASASLLQRRLRVGYARAARLLDSLEEHGIVGPQEGSKPREVFVSMDEASESFSENEE